MTANGVFKFQIWTTGMNETKLTGAKPPSGDIAGLANTAYHEARHAEQWFKMARLEAGTGDDAGTIAASTSIPVDIAAKAVQDPILPKSAEGKEAQAWFDSVYGANRDHRRQVYEDKRTTREALTPLAEARNTAVAEVNRLAEEYRSIPNTLSNINKRRKAYGKYQDAFKDYEKADEAYGQMIAPYRVAYEAYRALPEEEYAFEVGDACLLYTSDAADE